MADVVITGAGALSACGDLDATVDAVADGVTALRPIASFDATQFGVARGGEVPAFDARAWFSNPKALKLTDQRTRLTVAAAGMAVRNARLEPVHLAEAGVVIGTSGSDLQTEDVGRALGGLEAGDPRDMSHFASGALRRLNPLWLLVNLANMASAHVAITLEARGPNSTVTTDAIAGLQAIGEGSRWIRAREADVVVAGGSDTMVLPFAIGALSATGLTGAESTAAPADAAAVVTLETADHARQRGAAILARVAGYATAAGGDLRATMQRACSEAGWNSVDVVCEAAAFRREQLQMQDDAIAAIAPGSRRAPRVAAIAGHSGAATAPLALAIALRGASGRILVNAIGNAGQCASLAIEAGGQA